jgi:hypothetical protein
MLRLGAVLIAVVLLTAQAPILKVSKQPPAVNGQQKSADEQRGTEHLPVIVKVIETEKPKGELAREDAEHKEKAVSDGALVDLTRDLALYTKLLFIATALLVAVTGGLVRVGYLQIRDAKDSIAAAFTAAKAAQEQVALGRDEFNTSHRPKIRVRSVGRSRDNANKLGFSVVNIGDTKCLIIAIAIQIKKNGGDVPDTSGDAMTVDVSGNELLPGGFEGYQTHNVNITTYEFWDFCGVVTYADGDGVHRITGFWSRFDANAQRWIRPEDQDFNYEY